MAQLLLSAFARTDITDENGGTPIELARQRGYLNIVKLLDDPLLTTYTTNTGISTEHVTSTSDTEHVTNTSDAVQVNNVTLVAISNVTIHSVHYYHPDNTTANSKLHNGKKAKQKP
jgi:hypothetical protein